MTTATEWSNLSNLTIVGAFILGAIIGGAGVLHAVRSVVTLFERRARRRDDTDDSDPD